MRIFKFKSYAKVNLALNVISKKSNLHNIESIISFIDLYDLIFLNQITGSNHEVIFCGKFSKGNSKKNTILNLLEVLDKKNY